MTLIELFVPRGSLSESQRRHLGRRLVTELVSAAGAPADLLERGRALTWLVVHEPETWTVGGQVVAPDAAARYLVRISVPAGHLNRRMRAEMVERVTRVLAEVEDDPHRLYREPDAWLHILEVPDGNLGAFGRTVTTADVVKLVLDPAYQAALVEKRRPLPAKRTVVDPICGMSVELTDGAIVLAHGGTTHGFCNSACRDIFLAQHGAPKRGP